MGGKFLNQERDFKGVYIPKEIWLTPELTGYERLIFMEIYSLDRKFGCIAHNEHFAEWLGISERQVQDYIKRLKDKGLLSVNLNKAKDTRVIRVIGRLAHVTDAVYYRNSFADEMQEAIASHEKYLQKLIAPSI